MRQSLYKYAEYFLISSAFVNFLELHISYPHLPSLHYSFLFQFDRPFYSDEHQIRFHSRKRMRGPIHLKFSYKKRYLSYSLVKALHSAHSKLFGW